MKSLIHEQIPHFREQGYAILRGLIPPALRQKLSATVNALAFARANDAGVTVYQVDGQEYVHALEKVCSLGDLACLEALALPGLLETAEALCGPDFFMIQEFVVIKMLGDPNPVLWHQDMANERTGTAFTLGIYLDDAAPGDGALRVIPGSHISGKTICEARHDPAIEVPMRAGEVLIHDMMLAHSSGVMTRNPIRRVLYFEFVSASQVLGEGIYSEALVQRRTQLIPLAIRYRQSLYPAEQPFHWQNPCQYPVDTQASVQEVLNSIYASEIHARPSAYCFEPMKGNHTLSGAQGTPSQ